MSVLIAGSSHIVWHARYMDKEQLFGYFLGDCPCVNYIGISGGKVGQDKDLIRIEQSIRSILNKKRNIPVLFA